MIKEKNYTKNKTIPINSNILKGLFKNVYFINGNAYAGKSTMIKLLASKYNGILCEENYHDKLFALIDDINQPNLSYIKNMKDWQEFVTRTPLEYKKWIDGCTKEAISLEISLLLSYVNNTDEKKIFVDTNIPIEILHEISDYDHVLIMLADRNTSVNRFFDRDDSDKSFIYKEIMKTNDPKYYLSNYKKILEKINSEKEYNRFLNSKFYVIKRDDNRSIDQTLSLVEKHFKLID